ncbi:hypothetical protein BN946_scf184940.g28 [Trametes cinnabarina]|uniref:Uncharacterized protein n=1 Tax=Pycnoporus cinnabarinus TaxID=5643 RepID=A0A060SCF4_PYCCI|nr:hypothetical protein BN946_scf184940.g28 [Trametes cinnabarina]
MRPLALARRAGDTDTARTWNRADRRLGASFGGFIALVVVLAAIFLIACVGIFILLRDHEPTAYERRQRRARAREHDFSTEAPVGPPGLRERLARLFSRRAGWIKASAGDGDEWDASDERIPNTFSDLRQRDRAQDEYPATFAAARTHPRDNFTHSLSTDSVEVELTVPSAAARYGPPRSPGPSYLSSPEEEPTPSIRSAPVTPVSLSAPSLPLEAEADFKPRDEKHFSVQSGPSDAPTIRSMLKFDNGTKFKESL